MALAAVFLGYKISLEKLVSDKEAAYWFVRSLFFQLLSLSETHFTFVKYRVVACNHSRCKVMDLFIEPAVYVY